jgi:hypothetical protein
VLFDAIKGRAYDQRGLRTCVHELGQAFNLPHLWQKNLADPMAPFGGTSVPDTGQQMIAGLGAEVAGALVPATGQAERDAVCGAEGFVWPST